MIPSLAAASLALAAGTAPLVRPGASFAARFTIRVEDA